MKKLNIVMSALFAGSVIIAASCSSGTEQKAQKSEPVIEEAAPAPDEMATMMARGEQIYKEKCIACHQANGQGLQNAFPTLVGSDFLLNQTALAVSQVLNGSDVVSSSKEKKYPAPMPPQLDNKEDAVAVINYVLKNFGNNGNMISLEDVKDVEILPR